MLIDILISGVNTGLVYTILGVGFTLLWNSVRLINFAQGEFTMLGMFFAFTFHIFWKWPLIVSLILSILSVALLGFILERVIIRRVYGKDLVVVVVITLAIHLVLTNSAKFVWGTHPFRFPSIFGEGDLTKYHLSREQIVIFVLSLVCIILLHLFLNRTKVGLGMRALSQDHQTAMLMGIRVPRILSFSFVLVASLGAFAGILIAPLYFIQADIGLPLLIKTFIAVIIGGFGSYPGVLLGGISVAILDNVTSCYISSLYRDVITFSILIIFLIFKPKGLLGK